MPPFKVKIVDGKGNTRESVEYAQDENQLKIVIVTGKHQ